MNDIDKSAPPGPVNTLREDIRDNTKRVARLGNWPNYINLESLEKRIPKGNEMARGFDAGIACALDLIPRDKQKLAATLHAAYTEDAVEQVRRECGKMHPDSETTWWLAACSICQEGKVDWVRFQYQLLQFDKLFKDPEARVTAAKAQLSSMMSNFTIGDLGAPYGIKDGCMQGAYLAGHKFATMYSSEFKLYFIGTFHESLGLEDFPWSDEKDEQGQPKSGPVHGSRQFVKAANLSEFHRVIQAVLAHL